VLVDFEVYNGEIIYLSQLYCGRILMIVAST